MTSVWPGTPGTQTRGVSVPPPLLTGVPGAEQQGRKMTRCVTVRKREVELSLFSHHVIMCIQIPKGSIFKKSPSPQKNY